MKKLTKKEIYSAYGIDYENGKIFAPSYGFVNPLLIDGNEKIGKGIWHFSTLPTNQSFICTVNGIQVDVIGTCPCSCIGCYAMSGNYRYQSTKDSLALRTVIARNHLEFCENAINAQIEAENIKAIRIHASGDFFSVEYAEMWRRIATKNSSVVFWTYTKNKACETIFDGLENANIVKSVIPTKGFNFGHCDYIISTYEYLKSIGKSVYICRCGIDKNQHCVNCKGCSKNDYVLFIEHSTSYKAEKDSLYPILKALIESQPNQ